MEKQNLTWEQLGEMALGGRAVIAFDRGHTMRGFLDGNIEFEGEHFTMYFVQNLQVSGQQLDNGRWARGHNFFQQLTGRVHPRLLAVDGFGNIRISIIEGPSSCELFILPEGQNKVLLSVPEELSHPY